MEALKVILDRESENKYYNLISIYADKYLLTQKGQEAFNFLAERPDGSNFKLYELKGKVVFIDTWATWCAPCIKERPKVLEIAKKFGYNPELEVIMISVDSSREKWLKFLGTNNESTVTNIFVKDGINRDFGKQFNINAIPNYILIDKQGFIVHANIKEPNGEVEEMISKELLR